METIMEKMIITTDKGKFLKFPIPLKARVIRILFTVFGFLTIPLWIYPVYIIGAYKQDKDHLRGYKLIPLVEVDK